MSVYQEGRGGVVMGWRWRPWGILVVTRPSVSCLHPCQYPGSVVVPEFGRLWALRGTGEKERGISLRCLIQLHVNLQLSSNKKSFGKRNGGNHGELESTWPFKGRREKKKKCSHTVQTQNDKHLLPTNQATNQPNNKENKMSAPWSTYLS